jgi:hypothetical protein
MGQRSDPLTIFLVGRGVSLPTQTHDITYTHVLTHATHTPMRATYLPMRTTYAPTTYVPDTTHRHLTCHTYGHDWPGTHVHAACLMRPHLYQLPSCITYH